MPVSGSPHVSGCTPSPSVWTLRSAGPRQNLDRTSLPRIPPPRPPRPPSSPFLLATGQDPAFFSVFPLSFLDDPIDHGTVDARQPLSLTPRYPTCHPSKDQLPRDKRQPVSKMATPEARATDLKNQGNKAFAAHDWPTAIDFYSQAIKLNDKEPAFWSNRAQVRARRPRQPRLAPPFLLVA